MYMYICNNNNYFPHVIWRNKGPVTVQRRAWASRFLWAISPSSRSESSQRAAGCD